MRKQNSMKLTLRRDTSELTLDDITLTFTEGEPVCDGMWEKLSHDVQRCVHPSDTSDFKAMFESLRGNTERELYKNLRALTRDRRNRYVFRNHAELLRCMRDIYTARENSRLLTEAKRKGFIEYRRAQFLKRSGCLAEPWCADSPSMRYVRTYGENREKSVFWIVVK